MLWIKITEKNVAEVDLFWACNFKLEHLQFLIQCVRYNPKLVLIVMPYKHARVNLSLILASCNRQMLDVK